MEPITVKTLLKLCQEQVKLGNGDKTILISDDDEGNGFHTLFLGITSDRQSIETFKDLFHDRNNPNDVVLLG